MENLTKMGVKGAKSLAPPRAYYDGPNRASSVSTLRSTVSKRRDRSGIGWYSRT